MSSDAPLPGSAEEMAGDLRGRTKTSVSLLTQALDRISARDEQLNAFVHLDPESAMRAARAADEMFATGRDIGPLQGIPCAVKDIYDVEGQPTTCQSRVRADRIAVRDASVVERLRAAGAVLIGKLDTFEFALGGPSDDLPRPQARNPWNANHVPGGSSSGSGAAIGAGFVPLAPGTCTTGSIRGPAAWCGAVGLKPTFGRVSRRGVHPLAPSLDHCGPLTRSVHDAAAALQVMAGHDLSDPGSVNRPVEDYLEGLNRGVAGMTVAVPRNFFGNDPSLDDETSDAIDWATELLRDGGASVVSVPLPDYRLFAACARIIMASESFAIHRDDLRTQFANYGVIAARRFSIGAAIGAADYIDSKRLGAYLTDVASLTFERCDVMLTAISLTTAPRIAQSTRPSAWPLQASPWNLTGHPAIAVPMGLSRDRLPLSVQLVGPHWGEAAILRAARALERRNGWADVPLPVNVLEGRR